MSDWMQTFSGVRFWMTEPRVEDVRIHDIRVALSNLCRFTGHVNDFYSVAQHSVHVSELVPAELRLQALLHDAAEAYLGDIARPLKRHERVRDAIEGWEQGLLEVIGEALGVVLWPLAEEVRRADDVMLATEKRDLLLPVEWGLTLPAPREDLRIQCWDPWTARDGFRRRYAELRKDLTTEDTEGTEGFGVESGNQEIRKAL